jgi:hypothetical protein
LQAAADGGDRAARRLLLDRRAQALIGRARGGGDDGPLVLDPADAAEAAAIGAGLERLALDGDRDAMAALDQWLSAPLAAADPVRAAAWRLVARQAFGQPFPAPDRLAGAAEVLDDLDGPTAQAVTAQAQALFERCCREARR